MRPGSDSGALPRRAEGWGGLENGQIFRGNALGVIDAKGRTSLPADYRANVERRLSATLVPGGALPKPEVVLVEHPRFPCLMGYDVTHEVKIYHQLRARAEAMEGDPQDNFEDLQREHFGASESVSYDPSGRIVVPGHLREAAGLNDGLAFFVAAGDTFEIWNADRFREARPNDRRTLAVLDTLLKDRRK